MLPFTACTATKVTLAATKIAHNQHFTAVVTGSGIKSVVFYLDGRKVKTLTKPNSGSTGFAYTVPVASGRYGTHVLTSKTTTKCGTPQDEHPALLARGARPGGDPPLHWLNPSSSASERPSGPRRQRRGPLSLTAVGRCGRAGNATASLPH